MTDLSVVVGNRQSTRSPILRKTGPFPSHLHCSNVRGEMCQRSRGTTPLHLEFERRDVSRGRMLDDRQADLN
jgi:hypothetical protein